MTDNALSLPREAATSFGINAALSIAFFLGVFGLAARPLNWQAPDALAIDFVPQSIAVALMSALVPALVTRKRLTLAIAVRAIILRALGFAGAGALLGGVLAATTAALAASPIAWGTALALKSLYGGLLGAAITTLTLNQMMRRIAR